MQGYPPGDPRGYPPGPGGFSPPPGYGTPGYGPPGYGGPAGYGPVPGYGPPPGALAPYGVHPALGIPYSDKSKITAGLLQIFFGSFGVGRFYTGHTGLAVAQLLICQLGLWVFSWLTCGLSLFVAFWPLIDGILLLASDAKDAHGRLLR